MVDPQVHIHLHIQIQAAAGDRDYLRAAQRARRLRRILALPEGAEVTEFREDGAETGIVARERVG